ncbi:MAG: hypothetical protein LBV74_01200 [Tannerella sp.]|jgi:DNA-binding Lrp family transcriptional regulator|nr:hypothetical protein [Tannerella sp.]
MDYFKIIHDFLDVSKEMNIFASDRLLFIELINQLYMSGADSFFQQSNVILSKKIGIEEKTLICARKRLFEYGFINYKSSVGRGHKTEYKINNFNEIDVSNKIEPITQKVKPVIPKKQKEDVSHLYIEFEKIWEVYERKGNKKSSLNKWIRLTEKERKLAIEHIPQYVLSTPEIRFRKNMETYLNNESWNDKIIMTNGRSSSNTTDEELMQAVAEGLARAEYNKNG